MRASQLRWCYPLISCVILVAIIPLQNTVTAKKGDSWQMGTMSYLPEEQRLKPFLLGYHTTFANYLWIKTILYYGEHSLADKDFSWLVSMVDMVTRLNPHFYPAYEFAGLMLAPTCNNPDAAHIILNRGITHVRKKQYKLWFYLGWLWYQEYDDSERAAEYIANAARFPECPEYIAGLAATLLMKAGKEQTAREYMEMIYATAENPAVREYMLEKMRKAEGNGSELRTSPP